MSNLNKTIKSIIENEDFGIDERADCIERIVQREIEAEKLRVGAFLVDKVNTLEHFDKENVRILLSYYLTHAQHFDGVSFDSLDDFTNFMVWCHIHFEVHDVWFTHDFDKGILFEGWCGNDNGSADANKYSPEIMETTSTPMLHKKRRHLEEMYENWLLIKKTINNRNQSR